MDIYIKPSQDKVNPMAIQDLIDLIADEHEAAIKDILASYQIINE